MSNHPKGVGGVQWWHRIYLPGHGYTEGLVNHGPDGGDWPTTRFGMPEELKDKTVIDVGAWDGFFSFEAERRGANYVIAADCSFDEGGNWGGRKGFNFARNWLKSNVVYLPINIETPECIIDGKFDLVMCFGVLYHLKSPLQAMYNLFHLTAPGGTCLVETAMSNIEGATVLEYKPNTVGDPTNFFYPNHAFIKQAAVQAGFICCNLVYQLDNRATYRLLKA